MHFMTKCLLKKKSRKKTKKQSCYNFLTFFLSWTWPDFILLKILSRIRKYNKIALSFTRPIQLINKILICYFMKNNAVRILKSSRILSGRSGAPVITQCDWPTSRELRLRILPPRPYPLAPFSRAATGQKMAALLESLFLKKTDINAVLDWLKNAEVGLNWYFYDTGKNNSTALSDSRCFYEMTRLATDCKQNF